MVIWVRCCLILHNLIIHIEEGTGIDEEWQTELIPEGLERTERQRERDQNRLEEKDIDEDLPDQTRGQSFRRDLMDQLFDSKYTSAYRRQD